MVICAILSIALMVADQRYDGMASVRTQLSTLVTPIQWLVTLPSKGFSWASTELASQRSLIEENEHLRNQLVALAQRTQRIESLDAENTQLRELLKARPRRDIPYMAAELVMLDNDPYRQQMIIDQGDQAGVYVGQPVIDSAGVAGKVISVSRFTSRVLMINDTEQAVPIQVVRNGLRFIARGTGDAEGMQILHVPNNTDVRVGDLLVTSGLGGGFPAGYPVATVSAVQSSDNGPFAQVEARPSAHLERSRQFLLLFANDLPEEETTLRVEEGAIKAAGKVLRQEIKIVR